MPIGRKPDSARDGRAATHRKPIARARSKADRCWVCSSLPSRVGIAIRIWTTATATSPSRSRSAHGRDGAVRLPRSRARIAAVRSGTGSAARDAHEPVGGRGVGGERPAPRAAR